MGKTDRRHAAVYEQLVLFAYTLLLISGILSSSQLVYETEWARPNTILIGCSLLIFAFALCFYGSMTERQIAGAVFLFFVCVCVWRATGKYRDLVCIVMMMIVASSLEQRKVVRQYFVTAVVMVCLVLALFYAGVFSDETVGRSEESTTRMFLGFTYTTILANYYFHIVLAWIFIKRRKISVAETVIILFFNQVVYSLTDTRAVYYEVIMMVAILWLLRIFPAIGRWRLFKWAAMWCMPVLAGIMFYLAANYSENSLFYSRLDDAFSGRLALGSQGIEKYGFHLFGSNVEWSTGRLGIERFDDYFYVDSSYLNMALTFGILLFVIVCAGFVFMAKKSFEEREAAACVALMFLALHSFTDPQMFELRYDPFLPLIGSALAGGLPIETGVKKWQIQDT